MKHKIRTHSLRLSTMTIIFLICVCCAQYSYSAEQGGDPENARSLVKSVAAQMVTTLNTGKSKNNIGELRAIVDKNLVPHIDFRIASGLVLSKHWKNASEKQRVEFINQFRSFLVRFYTEALAGYVKTREIPSDLMAFNDEIVTKSPTQILISSTVKQPRGGTLQVVYRMIWNQSWKVVDVSVKGISMVKTYRSNFIATVEAEGLDHLISLLKERNATFSTK